MTSGLFIVHLKKMLYNSFQKTVLIGLGLSLLMMVCTHNILLLTNAKSLCVSVNCL